MTRYHANNVIDKNFSFLLWRQAVKPSFSYTIPLFVG